MRRLGMAPLPDLSDEPGGVGPWRLRQFGWLNAALLASGAVALGAAIQEKDGEFHPRALTWLTASLVLCVAGAVLRSRPGGRRGGRVVLAALAVGLAFQFFTLLTSPPAGYNEFTNDLRDTRPENLKVYFRGIIAAWVVAAGLLFDSRRLRVACLSLLFVLHLFLGAWLIRSSPDPVIDVFEFQQKSSEALFRGENPYTITFPDVYRTRGPDSRPVYGTGMAERGRLRFGFPYTPLSLFMVLPAYAIAGDHRYAQLFAMTTAGALVAFSWPGRVAALAAALLLFTPRAFFVLGRGWTEPLVVLLLALSVFCAARRARATPVALGLFLAGKQYLVFALPLTILLRRPGTPWRKFFRFVGAAALTAFVVTAPLALPDLPAFVRSTLTVQKEAPFRVDALSYLVAFYYQTGTQPGVWVAFAALLPAVALALWRLPRTPAGFAAALAVTYLPFIAFNKQAFANYYYFVIAALWCAVAATDTDATPDREAVAA